MIITLCCEEKWKYLEVSLAACGRVKRFETGVALAYYLYNGGICDVVVIAEEGARGMNDCQHVKEQRNDVPIIWISEQEAFYKQSRRMAIDTFLIHPVPSILLGKVINNILRKKTISK